MVYAINSYQNKATENSKNLHFENDLIEIDSPFKENINHLLNDHCHQERKQEISHLIDQSIEECSIGSKLSITRLLAKIVQHYKEVSHESKREQRIQQKKLKKSTEKNTLDQSSGMQYKATISMMQLGATFLVAAATQGNEIASSLIQQVGNIGFNYIDASSVISQNKLQISQTEFQNIGTKLSSAGQNDQAVEEPLRKALESLSSASRAQ